MSRDGMSSGDVIQIRTASWEYAVADILVPASEHGYFVAR
jgi:hypothetical protein